MSNKLIEERDERTKRRKKIKRKMDSIIGLSYHDTEHKAASLAVTGTMTGTVARLLDEGYCDNGFVLKKGALQKYLEGNNQYVTGWELGDNGWVQTPVLNLTPDFVGTVNLGHMDFATFPIILGEWTSEDLKLVDIENDRKALDIEMRLDEESVFVKELRRQNHDIGVSAEFWYHVNNADTQALSEMLGYYMPVLDEIFIFAYGLVGECGNVNSSGLELKGDIVMPQDINEVIPVENDQIETENDEIELAADMPEETEVAELAEDVSEEIEAAEEEIITEEEAEEAEETEEEEAESEEVEVEETETEEDSDEDEDDEADAEYEQLLASIAELQNTNAELLARIAELTGQITELAEANTELKKTNRRITNKLQNEKDKKEKFLANAKGISAKLFPNEEIPKETEKKVADSDYLFGDGIGDI